MNEERAPRHGPDPPSVPSLPSTPPGGYSLETVDVTRLSEILTRTGGEEPTTRVLGEAIIKALITDILRAKLGYSDSGLQVFGHEWRQSWDRINHWERVVVTALPEVSRVIRRLVAKVSLSADELEVVKRLDIDLRE
ncbi:hypothetical protein [Amycolatopsis pigmentata]|uniref:Asp23/Gls24 family envelope stress response protein n=1 Tax=Amycolatopsis pigmentata TaxID=450801 RepID=A0ABW5G6G4_9PSEU